MKRPSNNSRRVCAGSSSSPVIRTTIKHWQLEVWQHCIDTLPPQMLMYGTDTFWPVDPEMYREQYLQPQLGLFETATTLGHIVGEGSPAREEYRNMIFFQNALDHWQNAVREPQNPRPAPEPIEAPNAHQGHSHG